MSEIIALCWVLTTIDARDRPRPFGPKQCIEAAGRRNLGWAGGRTKIIGQVGLVDRQTKKFGKFEQKHWAVYWIGYLFPRSFVEINILSESIQINEAKICPPSFIYFEEGQ